MTQLIPFSHKNKDEPKNKDNLKNKDEPQNKYDLKNEHEQTNEAIDNEISVHYCQAHPPPTNSHPLKPYLPRINRF